MDAFAQSGLSELYYLTGRLLADTCYSLRAGTGHLDDLLPDALPPGCRSGFRRVASHERNFCAYVVDIPTRQVREHLRFAFLPIAHRGPVLRCVATRLAIPGMANYVAALIVLPVAGFLEDEVLGKMIAVVTDMQARDEDILRRRRCETPTIPVVDPEDPESA